jgi:hypothetical protein
VYGHLFPDTEDLTRRAVDTALGRVSPGCHDDKAALF